MVKHLITLSFQEYQRKRIEEKLEENAEKEKRKFKQETKLLIEEMHLEQSKISRLQQKMEMVDEVSSDAVINVAAELIKMY